MATTPWFRRRPKELEREQARVLREWLRGEVLPFNRFWADRLRGVEKAVSHVGALDVVPVADEADLAGVGGPGNPGLVLSPTEDQFKRHARRGDLLDAARRAGGSGATGRRQAIWYRYKPVHVHEAGVERLLAIAYTRADLDLLHLGGARLAEVMGWGAEDALVNLVPAGPSVRFWGLYHAALATRMTALHPRGAGQPALAAARRGFALLPASILAAPVGALEAVLCELADAGVTSPNLRMVAPVGPPPSPETRVRLVELAERIAGRPVQVQAIWAPETSRVLYGEAPAAADDPPEATYGLLTYPDLELLQVRRPGIATTDREGGEGELVVTSLGWRGTALIRLATGAWVGGIESRTVHPVTGATVPRIAPQVADAAWQPRVRTAVGTVRVDLRGADRVVADGTATIPVRDWSLRVVDEVLVLALDVERPPDDGTVRALATRVGEAVGAIPDVRLDPALAAARPQVGDAGPG